MIGKSFKRADVPQPVQTQGFDAYDLRLGDVMRGERATMGKSLLDVQRELKIKAAYIAAVENADPSSFDTPGFIPGYVRSYARYLGMNPDQAYVQFCDESGFVAAHGMSAKASSAADKEFAAGPVTAGHDIFTGTVTPFAPPGEAIVSRIEPRALGSLLVLLALVAGLGYGGWTVLQEVQKVQFAPVDQTPVVISELDPLGDMGAGADPMSGTGAPAPAALDRLYRPRALDVPVMVARDAPIATLRPQDIGTLVPQAAAPDMAQGAMIGPNLPTGPNMSAMPNPQVVGADVPELMLVAVRPAWVRVRAADGSVIYEGVMEPGQNFIVPATEDPAVLRVGESGALYFAVNGTHYGPVGPDGVVTSNITLSPDNVTDTYSIANLAEDQALAEIVRVAELANSQ